MLAYREIINDQKDLEKVLKILKSLRQRSEVIILPLEDDADKKALIQAQTESMKRTWANDEDEVWDAL